MLNSYLLFFPHPHPHPHGGPYFDNFYIFYYLFIFGQKHSHSVLRFRRIQAMDEWEIQRAVCATDNTADRYSSLVKASVVASMGYILLRNRYICAYRLLDLAKCRCTFWRARSEKTNPKFRKFSSHQTRNYCNKTLKIGIRTLHVALPFTVTIGLDTASDWVT